MASKMLFCVTNKYMAFRRIVVPSCQAVQLLDYYIFQETHS
jgi:hypothetical protein